MEYISNRKYNKDKDFFGFKMRTRVRYYDEKIINECLDKNKNIYQIPKDCGVVVDIGANIGSTSLLASSLGAKKIYSFEPEKYNYETLVHNVNVNGLSNKIECINNGVGKTGKQKLYVHPRMSGTTSSYCKQSGLREDLYQLVDFISIHDVFKKYNITHCDLLKLDCEGGEIDIIRDFDENLAYVVNQISLEFHDKSTINELVEKLSKWYTPKNTKKSEWVFKKI